MVFATAKGHIRHNEIKVWNDIPWGEHPSIQHGVQDALITLFIDRMLKSQPTDKQQQTNVGSPAGDK